LSYTNPQQRFTRSNSSSFGKLTVGAKDFADGPGLCDATSGCVRRIAIENLGEGAESVRANVRAQWLKITKRCGAVVVDTEMREREGSQQPAPNRPLMISGVSGSRVPTVVALIIGFAKCEAPEAVASEQALTAGVHDRFLLLRAKRTDRQRDGEYLIGAECAVLAAGFGGTRNIDHIEAAVSFRVPEFLEAVLGLCREALVGIRGLIEKARKLRHCFESVDPKRVDFDRLSGAGRDDPIANLDVHPSELNTRAAGVQKTIGAIDLNVVARAGDMRVDDGDENRK
jgi:hypothetical protein